MALNKPDGGLRPIAIGETIRRLVSKCCCWATTDQAQKLFGSLQVGVATRGGSEAVVHAVRKLAAEFGDDPDRIMLKVDFSNAFNMVDRTEMLKQTHEKLPGIYKWTEFCYAQPAHLFFGEELLLSMAGVQQGDPLGPNRSERSSRVGVTPTEEGQVVVTVGVTLLPVVLWAVDVVMAVVEVVVGERVGVVILKD